MRIKTYDDFLSESENIKVKKELKEFTLTHLHDAVFQIKSGDYFKEFSVTPYKDETRDKLKSTFNRLIDAIDQENVSTLYSNVSSAEMLDYKYGNVFPSKFSLMLIPELTVDLTDEQMIALKGSEKDFLLNEFSQLPKRTKDDILIELTDRAQILCCVIEALFYYIRTIDKANFFNGLSTDEIVEDYEKVIEESSKEESFSYDGPSSDPVMKTPLAADSTKAYWLCEKNLKKFVIFGTIAVKDLHAEENIGGTSGLKLSVSLPDDKSPEKDYNYFNLTELTKRVQMFYKTIKK